MTKELLLEIGCEELPASWLPSLTLQLSTRLRDRLQEMRLEPRELPLVFSTPRRLVATIPDLETSQHDFEESLTGPPVSAGYDSDGTPTSAAIGFARKHGVDVSDLSEVVTPKGRYLAFQKRHIQRSASEVLPTVLAATLRDLMFPKQMRWDAWLDDGRGEFLFGRPIRWLVFLLGGEVVPFIIKRADAAECADVKEIKASNITYGHRFIGQVQSGPEITVGSFTEYRAQLADRGVVLSRVERADIIEKGLVERASAHGGTIDLEAAAQSALLEEIPDLVECPNVISGSFSEEFLTLPPEILKTTMIHHQHFVPVLGKNHKLKSMFLAVTNTSSANADRVANNASRVLAARLRDARFFWDADRQVKLETRLDRLDTLLFHKKLGSYKDKTVRMERLSVWIAEEVLQKPNIAKDVATAARLSKTDLTTEMVGEFPELQGVMGGIYAREEGQSEQTWRTIYHHYLPVGPEEGARPTRAELGSAGLVWVAVALADKLDTIVGMFSAGERPTGSRDPFGLRRQAHGLFKILIDLPDLADVTVRPSISELIVAAHELFTAAGHSKELPEAMQDFLIERLQHVLQQRGHDIRNVRAVTKSLRSNVKPLDALRKLEVLPEFTESTDFQQLAVAFKRVRNIACELPDVEFELAERDDPDLHKLLNEDAERHLLQELEQRGPIINNVITAGEDYRTGFAEAARFGPVVDQFFSEVFVMVEDAALRRARLRLVKRLERLILKLGDISEVVPGDDT